MLTGCLVARGCQVLAALSPYTTRFRSADIQGLADALGAILTETELHVRLTEGWGIDRATLEAAPEKQATVAYTRYVLDAGLSGDLLDAGACVPRDTIAAAGAGAAPEPPAAR